MGKLPADKPFTIEVKFNEIEDRWIAHGKVVINSEDYEAAEYAVDYENLTVAISEVTHCLMRTVKELNNG